ncbi:unnamed protein product, partial [Ixodes pacificus]
QDDPTERSAFHAQTPAGSSDSERTALQLDDFKRLAEGEPNSTRGAAPTASPYTLHVPESNTCATSLAEAPNRAPRNSEGYKRKIKKKSLRSTATVFKRDTCLPTTNTSIVWGHSRSYIPRRIYAADCAAPYRRNVV